MSPCLLGHRGARARAPENTLTSLRRAIEDGADGFEFDVRVTKDGVPVLLHDATLDRTTDGTGRLARLERRELDGVDAGARFSAEFRGERIPELGDVLTEFLGEVTLALEMKEPLPVPVLQDLASRLPPPGAAELIVASFEPLALVRAREQVPSLPRALVLRLGQPLPSEEDCSALGLWGVFARAESIDPRFVSGCRRAELALFAYTVNDPADASRFVDLEIDGIISDDPGAVLPALR